MRVAIGAHRPGAAKDSMHRARDPGADRLHPSRQRSGPLGFDQEMHVVVLEGVVDQALVAQRWDPAPEAKRHVAGRAGGDPRATKMGNA
jgi:hypothetical protein